MDAVVLLKRMIYTDKFRYNKHFGGFKNSRHHGFVIAQVRLTGPDGTRSTKNRLLHGSFVVSRFVIAKFICMYKHGEAELYTNAYTVSYVD